ncbi:hypothetical protein [Aquirhabdus sp.]|uniref:hypothetical protein n=1 Tax=Aquirhabdus sp. TaxID=2824160 RepID=UPI00396CC0F2
MQTRQWVALFSLLTMSNCIFAEELDDEATCTAAYNQYVTLIGTNSLCAGAVSKAQLNDFEKEYAHYCPKTVNLKVSEEKQKNFRILFGNQYFNKGGLTDSQIKEKFKPICDAAINAAKDAAS